MYISNKYWNNYIGDSDDSLTLVEYLADKQIEIISLEEIFFDLKLNKLNGNFRQHDEPITVVLKNMNSNVEFYYPIDIIIDIAAILLECKKSGNVNLHELFGDDLKTVFSTIFIKSTQKEEEIIKNVLIDFSINPFEYSLSEMCPKEDMLKMSKICRNLVKELYEE
ncbi:imm68 putative immunity domain-containing protein [Fusobacterium polymorphum]|uniref:Uncharacterized protein n=1 Tax=Fusobacterium nucleatum subsp. polymorphum TaxID=76857 RepID=A0A2C6B576_FUSNP|nr:imm68 putative immunity domain-containing protein [Fusobacterium polymorphum]PHH99706.1 hypothetical protein CA836_08580 [Fusobacterium polymorphum]